MKTQAQQIRQAIFDSGKVPNEDIQMHVSAILNGDYSLAQLLASADAFYGFDGYAHEHDLCMSM